MILLALLLSAVAAADPVALRAAGTGAGGHAAVLGPDRASVALTVADPLAVTVGVRGWQPVPGSVSLGLARRWRLAGDADGGLDGVLHGEVLGVVATPGLGLGLGGALVAHRRGARLAWTGSLAVPAALRLLGPAATERPEHRVPLLLGTSLALPLTGPDGARAVAPGLILEAGPVLAPGGPAALDGLVALVVGWGPAPASQDVTGS